MRRCQMTRRLKVTCLMTVLSLVAAASVHAYADQQTVQIGWL